MTDFGGAGGRSRRGIRLQPATTSRVASIVKEFGLECVRVPVPLWLIRTRAWVVVTEGTVHAYWPDAPGTLSATRFHVPPSFGEYSIFTADTSCSDHLISEGWPPSKTSPPTGA